AGAPAPQGGAGPDRPVPSLTLRNRAFVQPRCSRSPGTTHLYKRGVPDAPRSALAPWAVPVAAVATAASTPTSAAAEPSSVAVSRLAHRRRPGHSRAHGAPLRALLCAHRG